MLSLDVFKVNFSWNGYDQNEGRFFRFFPADDVPGITPSTILMIKLNVSFLDAVLT